MIIRKTTKSFFTIEMTAQQARDLHLLLNTGEGGHVNELELVNSAKNICDSVHETITNLREALADR